MLTLTDRAADLTRQLLAFSRRQPLASVVTNVNDLISDYIKMLDDSCERTSTFSSCRRPTLERAR